MSTREPEPFEERPVMPTAAELAAARRRAEAEAMERPPVVLYAFVVWVTAGVVGVANAVLMLINKQSFVDHAIEQRRGANISNEQVASGATTLLWMFLVAAAVFAVLFALFAYKAQERERRARLMLTIMCVISVVFYLVVLQVYLSPLVAALTLAGTVLLYLPRANVFFQPGALPS